MLRCKSRDLHVQVLTKDSGSEGLHIQWDQVTFLCYCPKIVHHILQRLLHNTTAAQAYAAPFLPPNPLQFTN